MGRLRLFLALGLLRLFWALGPRHLFWALGHFRLLWPMLWAPVLPFLLCPLTALGVCGIEMGPLWPGALWMVWALWPLGPLGALPWPGALCHKHR